MIDEVSYFVFSVFFRRKTMKTFRLMLLALVFGACTMAVTCTWGDTLVYGARGTSDTAAAIYESTMLYGGVQSNISGPPRLDLLGRDITMGAQYAYMLDVDGHVRQLAKDTLSATGVMTNASTGWDVGDVFVSLDVGVDGYVYASRGGAAAVKLNHDTLTFAGSYSQGGYYGEDISVGSHYAYMVNASDHRIIQLTKDTLMSSSR
jgi:hypothetical protein